MFLKQLHWILKNETRPPRFLQTDERHPLSFLRYGCDPLAFCFIILLCGSHFLEYLVPLDHLSGRFHGVPLSGEWSVSWRLRDGSYRQMLERALCSQGALPSVPSSDSLPGDKETGSQRGRETAKFPHSAGQS